MRRPHLTRPPPPGDTAHDPDELARRARRRIVELAARKAIHLGAALSMTDLLTVLYTRALRYRTDLPDWPDRDLLVLSKGHGAYGLYAILTELDVLHDDLVTPPGHLSDHPRCRGRHRCPRTRALPRLWPGPRRPHRGPGPAVTAPRARRDESAA
ncbi:hypothetical protein SAZ11_03050 [Streptomyces sp. FXJ1.4098]|nr:hypothetical protein [Streptomyces sp. FXJ1.4098]